MLDTETLNKRNVVYGLYCTCHPYEIRYVGKTVSKLRQRLAGHRSSARRTDNPATPSTRWVKKHAPENVAIVVLEEAPDYVTLNGLEINWIAELRDSGHRLLNIRAGGDLVYSGTRPGPRGHLILNDEQLHECIDLMLLGLTNKELASKFSTSNAYMASIRAGSMHRWLNALELGVPQNQTERNEALNRNLLTEGIASLEQVVTTFSLLSLGLSSLTVGEHVHLSRGTVDRIRNLQYRGSGGIARRMGWVKQPAFTVLPERLPSGVLELTLRQAKDWVTIISGEIVNGPNEVLGSENSKENYYEG